MNNVDGLEELVLRLDADVVVPWFEAHTSGTPDEVRLYHRWLRTRSADDAAQANADLRLRLAVLRHLAGDGAVTGDGHRNSPVESRVRRRPGDLLRENGKHNDSVDALNEPCRRTA